MLFYSDNMDSPLSPADVGAPPFKTGDNTLDCGVNPFCAGEIGAENGTNGFDYRPGGVPAPTNNFVDTDEEGKEKPGSFLSSHGGEHSGRPRPCQDP